MAKRQPITEGKIISISNDPKPFGGKIIQPIPKGKSPQPAPIPKPSKPSK
ncbi:MAG: hypothetical protein WBI82_13820 [Sphaerochaeta sp.]